MRQFISKATTKILNTNTANVIMNKKRWSRYPKYMTGFGYLINQSNILINLLKNVIYSNDFESTGSTDTSLFGSKSFKCFGSYVNTGIPISVNQTISVWIKRTGDGVYGDGQNGFLGNHDSGSGIFIQATIKNNPFIYAASIYTQQGWVGIGTTIEKNLWYHVVFVMGENRSETYLNGRLMDSKNATVIPGGKTLILGRSWSGADRSVDGYIDNVKVINKAISPEEVAVLYQELH